jgi:hypothetical protein
MTVLTFNTPVSLEVFLQEIVDQNGVNDHEWLVFQAAHALAAYRQDIAACINCRVLLLQTDVRYFFGANEIGPFCLVCDRKIKAHARR